MFPKIDQNGWKRILSGILKEAEPVSDYEISKEYGDIEDYESFESEYEEEVDFGGLSPEDFNHVTVVLSLLGYDISSMTPEDVANVVARKPKLLELHPKYDISGSWCHTIRQTDMSKLAKTAKEMASIGKEICVTDANEAPFWDFSEYRRFALVFNGTCKVLWNADVYSSSEDGQLSAVDKPIHHLDKMTEGWLVPSECELVGIFCKDLKESEVDNFINVFKELGLDPNSDRRLQKTISGFELIEFEEAQEYFDIPYDSGEIDIFNIENPEDLYEENEGGKTVQDQLNDSLIFADYSGDIERVTLALENGANVHVRNDEALRVASSKGQVEVVKLLLEYGANVHANNDYALRWSSYNGHTEIVKLLLENGADVHAENDAALRWASSKGHVEIVKLLLESGADVHENNDYALRKASSNGRTETVKLLLEYGANIHAENDAALQFASSNGHTETVKLLLEYGANVHANNDYALQWASLTGHTDVVKLLLESGADISVLPEYKQKEYEKYTLLKKQSYINKNSKWYDYYRISDFLTTDNDAAIIERRLKENGIDTSEIWLEQDGSMQPIIVENSKYRASGYINNYIKAIRYMRDEQDFWDYLLENDLAVEK